MWTLAGATLITLLVYVYVPQTLSLVEKMDLPLDLQKCYGKWSRRTQVSQTVAEAIGWTCTGQYLWGTANQRWSGRNITTSAQQYMNRLMRSVRLSVHPRRGRRQATGGGPPVPAVQRVRKEYRMLTDRERADYHRAITILKADTVWIYVFSIFMEKREYKEREYSKKSFHCNIGKYNL
jgi:hypothetical protein